MEKLISFIIPAHNAETTIEKCIKSISVSRDMRIEIIIVENGSEDRTYQVVEALAKNDDRVRLCISEKGVSNARNKGIDLARGRRIVFVDADDEIAEGAMEQLIADAENFKSALVVYGHISGDKIKAITNQNRVFRKNRIDEAKEIMISNPTKYMQVWAKLFSARIIKDNNLRFNQKLRLSEDSDFTLRYLLHCATIIWNKDSIYRYNLNPSSTMRTFDENKSKDYIEAMQISYLAVADETKAIKKAFGKYILMHVNILMVREIFHSQNQKRYSDKLEDMKEIFENSIISDAMNAMKLRDYFSVRMIPLLFCKYHLYRLGSLVFIIRTEQNRRREG